MTIIFKRSTWSKISLAICLLSVTVAPTTNALGGTYDASFYSNNSILFYNPTACSATSNAAAPVNPPISASGTLDEQIANLFVVGFDASDTAGMTAAVSTYKIGGLFFRGNSTASLNKTFFDGLNKIAGSSLLISSDDEGGQITRFVPTAPSAAVMGTWDAARIEAQGKAVGAALRADGVTTALAPVLDLNGGNTIWTKLQRDWSADPATVADKAGAWARGLKSAGINPVYKHFPGLGHINVNTDLSAAPPVSLASLSNDIKPFQSLAGQNGGALMLGNMFISDWNGGKLPVSLSSDAVGYVRNTIKFNGVIMTDDLSAKYIDGGDIGQAVATAIEAGVDMPLFTGNSTTIKQVIDAVKLLPDAQAKVSAATARVTAYKTSLIATAPSTDSCCASGGGGSSTLSGDNNAAKIFNFMTSKGLTPAQAAGVVGNMIEESGVNPERLQGTGLNTLTPANQVHGDTGWGIVQWTPASKMIDPTTASGKDPNSLSVQLDYLWNDMQSALPAIKAATTPENATWAFENGFEHPADLYNSLDIRKANAHAIFENSKGVPIPPQIAASIYGGASSTAVTSTSTTTPATTSSSSCGGSSSASTTGYQNPFRDLKNSAAMRLDGGYDYGGAGNGSGPVYAVGNAKVAFVETNGSNWPGLGTTNAGGYISYTLSDGVAKGKSIYIAEDCTPAVKVGDIVTASTVICNYADKGTHLETGWSNGGNSYVSWSDYPNAENSFASNSGQDISKFLVKLGLAPGLVTGRLSTVPPPVNWPKW